MKFINLLIQTVGFALANDAGADVTSTSETILVQKRSAFKVDEIQVSNLTRMVNHMILMKIPFQSLAENPDGSGMIRVQEKDKIMLAPQELTEF